jgi:hypothetical protein
LPNGFGAWTSLPTAVAGDPNRQVAFQDVSLAAVGGSSGRVYVVGRDSAAGTNEVFWGYLDWAGNFSGWYKATLNGLPIVSAPDVSPSIALGPNGHVYMLLKSPPNAARAGNLRFYACDGSVWSVASDGVDFWLNEPHPDWSTVRGRPAMAFAWHRRGDTYAPLANGALWAWWMADNKRAANATPYPAMRYRWTWGALNASTANLPANIGKWHWSDLGPDGNPLGRDGSESQDQQCVGTPNYGSIGLAVTPTFGGLRAVLRYQANAWCSPGILWVPYADGQADATWPDGHVLGDHDDRTEIQANLCSSIYPGCPSMCSTFIPCAPGYNTASFACNVVPN